MALFEHERDMVDSIISAATDLGWLVYHQRPARTDKGYRTALQGDAGLPDLLLAKQGRLMVVECKMPGNRPTAAQQRWLDTLSYSSNVEVIVCYPDDYDALIQSLARREERDVFDRA